MHIKISWYLLRLWHNDDDGNLKADQCHGQLRCTSLIATLRPTNGSFASLLAYIIISLQLMLANGLAIVQGTKILNPSPNFVVSSSIKIKFGVLIEFDKFSPK